MIGIQILANTHAAIDMSKVFGHSLELHIIVNDLKDDVETFIEL